MKLSAEDVKVLARVFERYTMYAEGQLRNSMSELRRLENFKREMLREVMDETLLLQRIYPEFSGGVSIQEAIHNRTRMKPDVIEPMVAAGVSRKATEGPTEEQLLGLLREVNDGE
jgi:hypothetical protein